MGTVGGVSNIIDALQDKCRQRADNQTNDDRRPTTLPCSRDCIRHEVLPNRWALGLSRWQAFTQGPDALGCLAGRIDVASALSFPRRTFMIQSIPIVALRLQFWANRSFEQSSLASRVTWPQHIDDQSVTSQRGLHCLGSPSAVYSTAKLPHILRAVAL